MIKFVLGRLGVFIPTLLGVALIAFGLIRLVPGDPVLLLVGERGASPEVYEQMRANLGLNKSLPEQFWVFLSNAVQGDFGVSVVSKIPVIEEFWGRFPATLELGVVALFFATCLGIPLGIIAALKRNTIIDYTVMGSALIGYSMPIFWWGLILILVFSIGLGWTPVSGRIAIEYDVAPVTGFLLIDVWIAGLGWPGFVSAVKHLILPAVALGTIPLAVIARMTRSSMLEVIGEDYVRTAKAKGLSPLRVVGLHALRNALIPVITVIGLIFGSIMTGAILTETIFSWPGIGRWLVKSVTSRDYPVIQAGILIIASMVIVLNFLVDVLYAVINPRIRGK
jgi:dipeptide transport system permease protein